MSLGKQPAKNWPQEICHPEVKGMFVGGCVERGVGSKFHAKAHAHISGAHRGWICFRSTKWLSCRELLLHELAHIVTRQGHTPRWRAFLLQIGGTLDAVPGVLKSYHPRVRNVEKALYQTQHQTQLEHAATELNVAAANNEKNENP